MSKVRALLGRGNGKLGEAVHTWSLPAVETCPGASALCLRHCYARRGRYETQAMTERLAENREIADSPEFESRMLRELLRRCVLLCRWHVSGDFHSAGYASRCLRVFRRARRTRFWLYTRSWQVPAILPVLGQMAELPNVKVWFSADDDTGPPPAPPNVRVAWLEEADGDADPECDLVFRIRRVRKTPPRLTPLSLICPTDRPGDHDTDCGACGRCWDDEKEGK